MVRMSIVATSSDERRQLDFILTTVSSVQTDRLAFFQEQDVEWKKGPGAYNCYYYYNDYYYYCCLCLYFFPLLFFSPPLDGDRGDAGWLRRLS